MELSDDQRAALAEARQRFLGICGGLESYSKSGGALVFVPACAALDYLAKLAAGKDLKRKGYKRFIRDWLSQVRREYSEFVYREGYQDLPEQMYHVLRCGVLHSFSLVPDAAAEREGGRPRSIVLGHRSATEAGAPGHLESYSSDRVPDAAVFIVEDFVADIRQVTELVFDSAAENAELATGMLSWLEKHPPIAGGF